MYNVKNEYYYNHIYDDNRILDLELYIDDEKVETHNILNKIQITFDSGMDEYTVGRIIYGKLTTTFHKDQFINNGSIIKLIIKLKVFNTKLNEWEWVSVPWGSYVIVDHTRKEMTTDITAYSSPYKDLTKGFFPKNKTYNARSLMDEMITNLGYEFDTTIIEEIELVNPDITDSEGNVSEGTAFVGKTYGELMALIAMICSSNIIFDREGNIVFSKLNKSDLKLSNYRQPTTTNDIYRVDRVSMLNGRDETPIYAGNENASINDTLQLSNQFATAYIAQSIYNNVKDISYKSWSTTFISPLHIDPLDIVTFKYKGEDLDFPMLYSKYTYANNVFVCEFQCGVVSCTEKETGFKGTITQRMDSMYTDLVSAKEVLAEKVSVNQLNAEIANIGELYADKAVVTELNAKLTNIDELLAGNITSKNIKADSITSDKLVIADGYITSAMISGLKANKITAGVLDASAIEIVAKDDDGGEMRIYDNTIQISDGTRPRVQIGKDKSGDYNLYVWDADGNALFDENGITSSNIIRDDMIPSDASINANKIDVDSLFNVINNEKTNTIKSSQIFVESENQRLSAVFEELRSDIDNNESSSTESMTQLTTKIEAQQGQINTLVSDTTQIKETLTTQGTSINTMSDNYSKLEQTVNGINTTVGSHTSQITTLLENDETIEKDIESIESNISQMSGEISLKVNKTDYDALARRVSMAEYKITDNAIISTVTSSQTYINDLGEKVSTGEVISSINQSAEAITINANKINIEGAITAINNNTSTTINGNKITTGSITADQLQVSSITPLIKNEVSSNLDSSLTQELVFNKLTNNGQAKGIYMDNSNIYMNADYIKAGTVRADLVKVQLDEVSNLLPFNYITMKNGINTDDFHLQEDNDGLPFADCELPIYGGGGGKEYITKPFGYSNITIENGKHYWFTCEYYAAWGKDTKADDGVGKSVAGGSKYSAINLGHCLDIFLSNGNFADIADNDNYFLLASVTDFNDSVQLVERENYPGVYQRGWTRLVGRIDAKQDYTGNLWIQLDCKGFDIGDSGWFYIRNLQLTDSSVADESVKLDYIKQVKEKRIELTDGSFYTGLYSVDGIDLKEGTIKGESKSEYRKYTLDYDGYKLNSTTGSDNAFIGEGRSYYSYSAGSTGTIEGYDSLYGIGASKQIEDSGNREGIFIGVHKGFQIPNDSAYGRADIYCHNRYSDQTGDWTDWSLLGERIEPLGLVRRDIDNNITTNTCLYFNSGSAYINLSGKTYDLGAMLTSVATVSLDDEEVEVPALVQKVIELETKNTELESRIARLEEMLNQ